MTDEFRARGFERRSLLQALFLLPVLSAFGGARPAPPRDAGGQDDIVEVDGWILRRSDLS